MIRFIIRQEAKLPCGLVDETFLTMDVEVPELESELTRGGFDEDSYQRRKLLAIEIIQTGQEEAK